MIWFFGKRLAAIRIVERVFDDIKTPRATEVIEMIVLGINQVPARQLPVQVRAIIVATGLWNNPTAVGRLMMVGPISAQEAVHFLRDIGRAALELARKEGFSEAFSVLAGRERAEQLGVRWDYSGLTDRRPVADATTAAPLSPSQRPSAKSSNVAQQSGSSIEPSVPLYDISNEMPSDAFVECWQAAQRHLNSMVQDGIETWLKGAPTPPFREHLSFRLGNQLFLIRIENPAGQLVVPSTRMGLLAAADDFGGWPCIMPMTRARNGHWEPVRSGWGLVDARDGKPIDPFAFVSDEEIEMTDGELHHFAVQVVEQQLVSTGVKVSASQGNLGVDPSIWIMGERGPEWVVVRAAKYPKQRADVPEHWGDIVASCRHKSVRGHFASVAMAGAASDSERGEASLGRLLRGHGMHVRYTGLEKVAVAGRYDLADPPTATVALQSHGVDPVKGRSRAILVVVERWPQGTMAFKFGRAMSEALGVTNDQLQLVQMEPERIFRVITSVSEHEFRASLAASGVSVPEQMGFVEL